MVSPLLKSTLREIRQSLGRFLAIFAIVGLGVGFFAGLRMSQPSMMATGVTYLKEHAFYDFRLLSTLGFTEEDVEAFSSMDGISSAHGSVYTDFLWQMDNDEEAVLTARMLTDGLNHPNLTAGRMPEHPNECLADANFFPEEQLGQSIRISAHNDEDTLDLLAFDEYTVVGLADTPLYFNYERGTTSIGSGTVAAFLLLPEGGFDFEAYYEIYLGITGGKDAYSDEYQAQIDALQPQVEALLKERATLRYDTLYGDALDEIREGEQELADGWEEYRTERADAEQELADAHQELLDGEQEYTDGLADYEQGKLDYADGLREYQDGLAEYEDGLAELADGKAELEDAIRELNDAKAEVADGWVELNDAKLELEDGRKELADAKLELDDAKKKLDDAFIELHNATSGLSYAEESYSQLSQLHQSGEMIAQATGTGNAQNLVAALNSGANPMLNAAVDGALQGQGSSLDEFLSGWSAAESSIGRPLDNSYLSGLRSDLDGAQHEVGLGANDYWEGVAEYEKGLAEYEDGLAELEKAEQEIADAEQELLDAEAEIADGEIEIADAQAEIADAEAEIAEAERELEDARIELADAAADLEKAPQELADARIELDDGWKEYKDGLAEAEQEFADAEAELADGEQEIADAYEELGKLKEADLYTLSRQEDVGYASFDNDTSIIHAISVVFPVFFFLVAALVCMTTMKRMVEEQRTQIGVLKAMGYSRQQIIGKYLFYSGSAAITGGVLGYAVGSWGLPVVIWEIYGIMYGFAPLEFVFDPLLATISFAAALLCSMGATYLSCRMELTRHAAELIRPKTPKPGKRVFLEYITPIWKRLGFLRKVSIRNVLRYRSRLIMMILGIGGCTALLVTGFGLRDSLSSIVDDQYNEITLYDYAVNFTDPITREEADEYLLDRGWEPGYGLLVHSGSTDVVSEDGSRSVSLVVPAGDSLDGFISLHSGEEPIPFPAPGDVVINYALARDLSVEIGDTIRLRDDDLGTVEATVSGICDNYIFNYVFVSPETYRQQLGLTPEFKSLYVLARSDSDPYEESVILADAEDIGSVSVNVSTRERLDSMLNRLDIIVVIVVVCAAALAFIVLYNLTNINITERIREIATIKVLGFYQKEVATYVFREINMLSALGSLFGLLMGKGLHYYVMAQVQVDGMFFPCWIAPTSYLISLGLTILFTWLITHSMRPRLKKIDMAESLKSIE